MDKFIGKTLDNRYAIEDIIGVGGMAVVYRAKDSRLNRYVALKILKDEYAVDRDFRRRFHDESQAVAMLSHPNIVTVYDVSRTDNTEYIVMELIDGITLKDYMRKRGNMGWKEITFFSIQIAKALEHAHSRGIIHRDIKPQNIMLLRDGTVKVADFGIARHVSKQDTYNMGEAIGSVHYVSPEQARGSFIDNRADIYSFGVVMYEMMTGRLPFEADSPIAVALQHINSIALPPTDFVPDIPPALEAITMKAMNPNLSKRYTSATEMLADLESYRNDPNFTITIEMQDAQNPQNTPEDEEAGYTRRINNTGEVEKLLAASKGQGKNGGTAGRDGQVEKRRKRSRDEKPDTSFPTSIIFSLLAVVLFFGGAIYFMVKVIDPFSNTGATKYQVPYLYGEKIQDVLTTAEQRWPEFTIVEGESIYDDKDAGTIIGQTPAPKRMEDKGTVITVQVSRGPKSFKLSNYEGVGLQYVELDFQRLGLADPIIIYEKHDEIPANCVIKTTPAAGSEMTAGDQVELVVSQGRDLETMEVPDLSGMLQAEAKLALEARKLVLGEVYTVDGEEPEGTVTFQTLPPGSKVPETSVCDIHISKGPQLPPDLPDPDPEIPPFVPPEPPAENPDLRYADGNYFTPEWYDGRSDLVYYDYSVAMIDAEGSIEVLVYIDNGLRYKGTHVTGEGTVVFRLLAPKGEHHVRIHQNDVKSLDATLNFQ